MHTCLGEFFFFGLTSDLENFQNWGVKGQSRYCVRYLVVKLASYSCLGTALVGRCLLVMYTKGSDMSTGLGQQGMSTGGGGQGWIQKFCKGGVLPWPTTIHTLALAVQLTTHIIKLQRVSLSDEL